MLEMIRAVVCTLKIKDIQNYNVLVFKGLYALPTDKGLFNQFRFRRVLKNLAKKK